MAGVAIHDPHHGEIPCQSTYQSGQPCRNNAYYKLVGDGVPRYLCGQHSRNKSRTALAKDPHRHEKRRRAIVDHEADVVERGDAKRSRGEGGSLTCVKLRMMHNPELRPKYRNVFPNFKHQTRPDGFGCRALSPKAMGPINHDFPGLPTATSIENFHRFNKYFESNESLEEFAETQRRGYSDPEPHRHKFGGVGNVPTCAMLPVLERGDVVIGGHHYVQYDYLTSRYFYCHYYELMATCRPDYDRLQRWLSQGQSLQIVGYDGFDLHWAPGDNFREVLMEHYRDVSKPFGHEVVLFSMLVLGDPRDYPWNRFWEETPWYTTHFPQLAPLF